MELFSDERIARLRVWRKNILRIAIWLLIAGVIAGVLLILLGDTKEIAEAISKTMGNIFLVAVMMVVCVLSFHLIESRKNVVQIFSTICLFTSLVWALLWSLSIWAWEPLFMTEVRDEAACTQYIERENNYVKKYGGTRISTCPDYVGVKHELTVLFRLTAVITIVSGYSLIAALIMNLYEGKRKDLIRPLKIVGVSLAGYEAVYFCLMVLMNWPDGFDKMGMLAGFAGTIWFLVIIVAWVISHNEKGRDGVGRKARKDELAKVENEEKQVETAKPMELPKPPELTETSELSMVSELPGRLKTEAPLKSSSGMESVQKSDEELRAEIEEQVRREMIEKQVREKLEKEMKENGHL